MEYLIGLVISSVILFLAVMFYKRSNLRVDLQTLSVENKRLKEENEQQGRALKRLLKEQEEAELNIQKAEKDREVAQQRAAEAYENTERVLLSEQRRLAAELQHKKELEEVRFEQEKEKRQEAINLYFNRLNVQAETIYKQKKEELQIEITLLQSELNEWKSKQEAINQEIQRQQELEDSINFHRI